MKICSHSECRNKNKDVNRWTLTDKTTALKKLAELKQFLNNKSKQL